MKMPRQKAPAKVRNMDKSISKIMLSIAIAFLLSLNIPLPCAAASDSFLADLSDFVSRSLSRAIGHKIDAGKFDAPRSDGKKQAAMSPEIDAAQSLYRQLLDLKFTRKDYTDALQQYLMLKRANANFLAREEAYARLADAVDRLGSKVEGVIRATYDMGLELDTNDREIRRRLENYTDAKSGSLREIGASHLTGLSLQELADANDRAKTTGELLDKTLDTLLSQILARNPEIANSNRVIEDYSPKTGGRAHP
jgi:hypothetical protein